MQQYDVIIMGAGMVGLSVALGLAQHTRLRILLIEQADNIANWQPDHTEQRVSAINQASQQWLQQLGAWPDIATQRCSAYQRMYIWDAKSRGHIEFSSQQLAQPNLGYILENQLICQALYQALRQHAHIDYRFGQHGQQCSITPQGCQLTLASGERYQTALLIGADGAHSWVRQQAQLGLTSYDYGHHALVTRINTELPHQATAWQVFLPSGPLALLPLQDPQQCSIVWSCTPEQRNQLSTDDLPRFSQQLTEAFEHKLGTLTALDAIQGFPLTMRQAHQYHTQHVALVGDAAHTIHPLAGQGVNMGFLDAKALVETLVYAAQHQQPLGHPMVLARYQRARRGHNLQMASTMQGLKSLFASDNKVIQTLRGFGLQQVNQTRWLKQILIRQAMGLV